MMFRTIELSELSKTPGFDEEKSLLSQTLASPRLLNPTCSSLGLNDPENLASFLYPDSRLECRWRTSGKGMCWTSESLKGIFYKNRRPRN
jgi:hypothetical protein